MSKVVLSVLALASLFMVGQANATLIVCDDASDGSFSGSGSPAVNASSSIDTGDQSTATVSASECGPYDNSYATGGNDSAGVLNSGVGNYGITNWVLHDKGEVSGGALGGVDYHGSITGDGWGSSYGSFSFRDTGADWYLIVLKYDGVFASYLSDSAAMNWAWDSDYDGNGNFVLSHLSVYTSSGGHTVPTPATLALVGIGLIGIGWGSRRKR
jgi:hypothetical protein